MRKSIAKTGSRIPVPLLFVTDGLCQYTGSAVAVAALMPLMAGFEAAWWRVSVSAIMLMVWRRPWRKGLSRREVFDSCLVGMAITLMNMTFYESLYRIDMGTAVSIEFIGPVLLAVITGLAWQTRIGALLAFGGVVSIGGIGLDITDTTQRGGFILAILAGLLWTAYIWGGTKIAHARSGIDSLAIGMTAGAIVTLPFTIWHIPTVITSWKLLGAAIIVGLMASAIPFTLEQVIMGRMSSDLYSLLSAIMPATSALIGAVMLRQIPSFGELLGMFLISTAVALVNLKLPIHRDRNKKKPSDNRSIP